MNPPLETPPCRIEQSLGRTEPCPGANCPFWDAPGGCVFEELDLGGRGDLARWLHDLRQSLATPAPADEATRRMFFERRNEGRTD